MPPWCRRIAGDGPTLLLAPHAGLCTRDLLAGDAAGALRGNDLFTDDVASLLAARLDATLVVNPEVDRNELDLNRVSEVVARAPWLLEVLREELERILARHPVAQLLIVHGWHVVDPRCDVGIGVRLTGAAEAASRAGRLTVSPCYVDGVLERLRVAGEDLGIRTTYGERWPAAHRNNVMQIFRRHPRAGGEPLDHALATLAASGRIEAVQLELGAPLRWPGAWRERFVAAAAAAFGAPRATASRGPSFPSRASAPAAGALAHGAGDARSGSWEAAGAAEPRGVALQAFDLHAGDEGLGIVVGVGAMSPDELGARLLLLPGGQRVLLFTGHERIGRRPPGTVGGLAVRSCAGGFAVQFMGPVLELPDASRYFRHERAQREAALVDLRLDLRFAARDGVPYGCVEGTAELDDGRAWRIAAHGFTDPVLARGIQGAARTLRLTASFGAALGVTAMLASDATGSLVRWSTERGATSLAARAGDALPRIEPGRLPAPFSVGTDGGPWLHVVPRSHVTILRPSAARTYARVTFGAVTCELADGRVGGGFYEHGEAA